MCLYTVGIQGANQLKLLPYRCKPAVVCRHVGKRKYDLASAAYFSDNAIDPLGHKHTYESKDDESSGDCQLVSKLRLYHTRRQSTLT